MTTPTLTPAQEQQRKADGKAQVRRQILQRIPQGGHCIEIGVWRGEFTGMLLNRLKPKKLTLIDPWKNFDAREDAFDGKTKDAEFEAIYQSVLDKYAKQIASGQIDVRRALSSEVLAEMAHDSLDFAYLDGDHAYQGVKADLDAVYPLMKEGGIIMLDDYHRRGWWGDGVIRAVHEFLGAHPVNLRIFMMRGAQLALEKQKPSD